MGKAALIAAAALMMSGGAPPEPAKHQAEAPARKVEELQKERIAALRSAAEVSLSLARNARLDPSDAIEDRIALLGAELDAAGTEAGRMAIYKETLDAMKGLEDVAKARMEAARGTELSVHRIRARRLEVEIRMEREKSREAK